MRALFWGLFDIWNVIQEMIEPISIVILLVLVCRVLVGKVSKQASYFLWTIVAIRLLVPVLPASEFSIFNIVNHDLVEVHTVSNEDMTMSEFPQQESWGIDIQNLSEHSVISNETADDFTDNDSFLGQVPVQESDSNSSGQIITEHAQNTALWGNHMDSEIFWRTNSQFVVWLIGMTVMSGYGVLCYCVLKRKLGFATTTDHKVYETEHIISPFVFGIIKPRIYLPYRLSEEEREYILLHEQYHIRRRDYLVKILAFGILAVYWFHPLVWIAFYLMSRDMEMSCDEQVIKCLGVEERKAYSTLLLSFASGKRFPLPSPLAFGENDTKSRIKQILNYKSPTLWGILIVVFLILVVAACCLTDAKKDEGENTFTNQSELEELAEILFERKNAYIGDIVANGKLLNTVFEALEISGWNGSELQTRLEPYWISLSFDTKPSDGKMWQASAMYLALVENANEVRWSFYNENENLETHYVTVDVIEEQLNGIDIKTYAVSEEKIAELWTLLEETRSTYEKQQNDALINALVLSTDWDRYAVDAGLDFTERIEWENRLTKDAIGYRGGDGSVSECFYQDFDQNGTKDLIVVVRDYNWEDDVVEKFCIYMNDEPVYAHEINYGGAFWDVITADVDNDGFLEFLFYGDSGGTGGYGFNAIFELLKYKNGTFETMPLPLDEYCEWEDETAGFGVEVYTAKGEGNYIVSCPAIGEKIAINIGNTLTEVFDTDTPANTLVGRECYGFHKLMPVLQDGRYYLLAEEGIYRTNIYQRMENIGTAQFLLEWDNKLGWTVKEFEVYAGGENVFHTLKSGLEYYPSSVEELQKNWRLTPIINNADGTILGDARIFTDFAYTTSRRLSSNNIVYAKLNEKEELAYVSIEYKDGKYYYVEDYSRCTDKPYYLYGEDYYEKVYTNALHFAQKYANGDCFEHFYLTNEENLTEKDIFESLLSSQYPPKLDFISVYAKKLDAEGMKEYTKYTGDFVEQGIKITMPSNSSWIIDPHYELVDEVICGTYTDYHIDAEMKVLVGEQEAVFEKAEEGLKEKLSEWSYETWSARTKDGTYIETRLYVETLADTNLYTVVATWEYEGNTYLLYGNTEVEEGSTVAKTALHIIGQFEKHE